MSHSTVHTLIGLFLFATGLVALFAVSTPEPATPANAATSGASSTPASHVPDRMVEIEPAIEQVLLESGRAGTLSTDELSQVPPKVLRVLVENGEVLTLPVGGG